MKTVNIKYFAALRETTGLEQEAYETRANTYRELYDELSAKYAFTVSSCHLKVAVGTSYVDLDSSVHHGDQVVFIPPVAGG